VTGKTWRGKVCTVEFVLRFSMVFDRENATQEPIRGVALRTIRTDGIDRKLLIVIIFMAICATLERHRVGHFF